MNINLLSKQTVWYGRYSGYYEQIPRFLEELHSDSRVRTFRPQHSLLNRIKGKAYAMQRGWPARDQALTAVEMSFTRVLRKNRNHHSDIYHVLNLEEHLFMLEHWEKAPQNLVGTIHFPRAQWNEEDLARLRRLSSAVVLYQADTEFFESYVGKGRVKFVYHGVDAEFFQPRSHDAEIVSGPRHIVFVGQYMRNVKMLQRVITALSEKYSDLVFDLIVSKHAMCLPDFMALHELNLPLVRWHHGISDEELRSMYQNAFLMLLPMNASGANNAVVEALACGLPIVTTDIGGIRDYGGASLYPVSPNDGDESMIAIVEEYLRRPQWRDEVGREVHAFAQEHLAWPTVARQHMKCYEELAGVVQPV